jgi:hypothetical protein
MISTSRYHGTFEIPTKTNGLLTMFLPRELAKLVESFIWLQDFLSPYSIGFSGHYELCERELNKCILNARPNLVVGAIRGYNVPIILIAWPSLHKSCSDLLHVLDSPSYDSNEALKILFVHGCRFNQVWTCAAIMEYLPEKWTCTSCGEESSEHTYSFFEYRCESDYSD